MIVLPDLRKQVSCICLAVNVMHVYVDRCMHGENEDPGIIITGMLSLMFYISLKCCHRKAQWIFYPRCKWQHTSST